MADDEIVIERREIVGRVRMDPYGTVKPLVAAYQIIGEYLSENDTAGTQVEFIHFGRTYRAGVDPENDPNER